MLTTRHYQMRNSRLSPAQKALVELELRRREREGIVIGECPVCHDIQYVLEDGDSEGEGRVLQRCARCNKPTLLDCTSDNWSD